MSKDTKSENVQSENVQSQNAKSQNVQGVNKFKVKDYKVTKSTKKKVQSEERSKVLKHPNNSFKIPKILDHCINPPLSSTGIELILKYTV